MLSARYDRLATALVWLGRFTPARLTMLSRIRDLGELATAVGQAQVGLEAIQHEHPTLLGEVAAARSALLHPAAVDVQAAGAALLAAAQKAGPASPVVRNAVSGLYGASLLLRRHQHFLRLAGVPGHS